MVPNAGAALPKAPVAAVFCVDADVPKGDALDPNALCVDGWAPNGDVPLVLGGAVCPACPNAGYAGGAGASVLAGDATFEAYAGVASLDPAAALPNAL